jgi:uncharacterized protein
MAKKNFLNTIALLLVIIGGLNWGLIALFGKNANIVESLFGTGLFTNVVYFLVGLSALYALKFFSVFKKLKK